MIEDGQLEVDFIRSGVDRTPHTTILFRRGFGLDDALKRRTHGDVGRIEFVGGSDASMSPMKPTDRQVS